MKKFLFETWLTEIVDVNNKNPEPRPVDSITIEAESFDDAVKKIRKGVQQI